MKAWYKANSARNHQGIVADEETGEIIAVVHDPENTVLLAAAPDLLEACEAVKEWHESDSPLDDKMVEFFRAIQLLNKAIVKAKGEDQ